MYTHLIASENNHQFYIKCHKHGVMLTTDAGYGHAHCTVGDLFNLPVAVYCYDTDNHFVKANDHCAAMVAADSGSGMNGETPATYCDNKFSRYALSRREKEILLHVVQSKYEDFRMFSSSNKSNKETIQIAAAIVPAKDDNATGLKSVPKDIFNLIGSHQFLPDARDVAGLGETCRFLYHQTQKVLYMRKLAHCVVVAPSAKNRKLVIAAMLADPALIGAKVMKVTDITGRRVIVNKTLFQLAAGAGDSCFCEDMEVAFIKHFPSKRAAIAEMEQQRNEILESKADYLQREAACQTQLVDLVRPFIAVINAERFDGARDNKFRLKLHADTYAAIATFQQGLAKIQPAVVDKGTHFRYALLHTVFSLREQLSRHWEHEGLLQYQKLDLFDRAIIANIQSYLPVNDAQLFSQGLRYLLGGVLGGKQELCQFVLTLRDHETINFYDALRGESAYAGFNLLGSCVNIDFGSSYGCHNFDGYFYTEYLRLKPPMYKPEQKVEEPGVWSRCVVC